MKCAHNFQRWWVIAGLLVGLLSGPALGQHTPADPMPALPPLREIALDSIQVAPQTVDISGWLLLDKDIEEELSGAVHNLYDFKFNKADKQFRSLRRRYPQHPMAYFLLSLSTWWKMMPNNVADNRYDKVFLAYTDTAITKAAALYKADEHNYEACFFLAGAYGMQARLHAERHDWRKATVASRRALNFLQKSQEANGLSSEFLFGQGLFNYYSVWIGAEYTWLRPILFFFPKGSRERGLAQLREVSQTAFYTGTEAKFFLVNILSSARENQAEAAFELTRQLNADFPDNSYFELEYAKLCFRQGRLKETEQACRSVLQKYGVGQVGYEAYIGRAAAYMLGYLMEQRYHDPAKAKDYYQRCVVYSEQAGMTKRGYYIFAETRLARLAVNERDAPTARRYYSAVLEQSDSGEAEYKEARTWLRTHPQ
ncbi:tol-pal system protein YbgF [Hymenobacter sp. HMF4947]|uniref:Tol-pal system protein YbgF n=1 Tax=Hymenobacter ginkgonis TaxID=2682976 RepID=A0A7K1TFW5_9BACT|nr:tol-pal system protein YbgF [Hymenobacter ginkgonis]MVN77293.1 tol-pal system protein YbgF [Hymenobacter ginkgonis]